jgi:hypothetical protein
MRYFQYKTNINLSILNDIPANFPAVTICNLNPFFLPRVSNYISNILQKQNLSYLNNLTNLTSNDPLENAFSLTRSTHDFIMANIFSDPNLNATSRQLFGWKMEEMLVNCYYNQKQCYADDFKWVDSTYEYGNCYTFNSNSSSPFKTSNSGLGSGLHLELYVGNDDDYANFIDVTGANIIVHNQTITPLISSEGFVVAPGFESLVSLKRTFMNKLADPFSSCIINNTSPDSYNSDAYFAIFNNLKHETYRQKYCIQLCYQEAVITNCSCYDLHFPNMYTSEYPDMLGCISDEHITCMHSIRGIFEDSPLDEVCIEDCPLECSTIIYSISLNQAKYLTELYYNWLKLQENFQQFLLDPKAKESILKLNIFYETLEITVIEDTPQFSLDSLWANVGGVLGLFLGS